MDIHKNFAYAFVDVAPEPGDTGLTLKVTPGKEVLFPTPPFTATVGAVGEIPTVDNATLVRVTAIDPTTHVFTFTRLAEGIANDRTIQKGDQIFAGVTAGQMWDVEVEMTDTETNLTIAPSLRKSGHMLYNTVYRKLWLNVYGERWDQITSGSGTPGIYQATFPATY